MNEYVLPDDSCPFCGDRLDRSAGDRAPQPGDLSLCANCQSTLVWDPQMRLALYDETNLEPVARAKLEYLRWLLDQMQKANE